MRVYGRIRKPDGSLQWIVVQTSATGDNSMVYLTALCQCLYLNLGESPFYASNGIPAQQDVIQQTYPDFYLAQTQRFFAPYFASLRISRVSGTLVGKAFQPTYEISIITKAGAILNRSVPIPQ